MKSELIMTKITKYSKITLIPDEILELKGIYKIISPSNNSPFK